MSWADDAEIDQPVARLFALVSEALAAATHSLLADERATARMVIERDGIIDDLAAEVESLVWERVDSVDLGRRQAGEGAPPSGSTSPAELRRLVGILLILPELERSADLAEHVAQRALAGVGREMSPLSRGIVQRMTEVGLEMWSAVAAAYARRSREEVRLDEADEELDILHERLTTEVSKGSMDASTAAQVTLLARFYERLGDHAVNLARRIGTIAEGRALS